MALTTEFLEAVQSGKIIRVRIMLKDSLLVDPTGAQFDEMERFATKTLNNVYTEHDGEKLNFDVSSWNEKYLNEQMVAVVNCFSRERIELLKNMVRFLYKEKADKIRNKETTPHSQNHLSRKQVGAGVTIVGAAFTVAGICTSHTALTIGGAVVAIAGIALVVSDKGNE